MNIRPHYYNALLALIGEGKVSSCSGRNAEYHDGVSVSDIPSDAEIDAKLVELETAYDAQDYARKRKAEYDQLNQFEMQFDDKEDSTTTWVDKINEIKGRHPK